MVENPHHCKCLHDTQKVSDHACVEVRCCQISGVFYLQFLQSFIHIELHANSHKNSRHNDISQSQHAELLLWENGPIFSDGCCKVREDQFDGNVKVFGDSYHDISSVNPKNVVEKECPQEYESNLERAKVDCFECSDWEENTKDVVEEPVFSDVKHDDWDATNDCGDNTGVWNVELSEIEIIFHELPWVDVSDDFFHWLGKVDVCEEHAGGWYYCGETELKSDEEVYDVLVDELVQEVKAEEEDRCDDGEFHGFAHVNRFFLLMVLLFDFGEFTRGFFGELGAEDTSNVHAAWWVEEKLDEDRDLVGEADKVGEDDNAEGDDDVFDEVLLGLLLRGTHGFKNYIFWDFLSTYNLFHDDIETHNKLICVILKINLLNLT